MNIGFYLNHLLVRGTSIAAFDYAYYNEKILNNKSYIFYLKNSKENNNDNDYVFNMFNNNFVTIAVDNFEQIDEEIVKYNIKFLYNIKFGNNDNKLSKIAKNICHCVHICNERHGDVYCSVSKWVSRHNNIPVLPHIVYLPNCNENMREKLNIPKDAIVFGRHGGYGQFDIDYVHRVIYDVALNNPNIYFLFVNTKPFCSKISNIIHIDCIMDVIEKRKFINTCDGMIWGRSDGETFGLAIAEFSFCNKPVIATNYNLCHDNIAHYYELQDKGLWYNSPDELKNLILNFNNFNDVNKDWNAYKQYSPENVMKIFKEMCIDPFI